MPVQSDSMDMDAMNEDEDMYNNDETIEDEDHVSPPPKKKKKKNKATNIKPPTAEEMTHLRETENLFNSNLIRMKIEELIKEVRTNKMERNQMKHWIRQLEEFLINIESYNGDIEKMPMKDSSYPKDIVNPLQPLPDDTVKITTTFHKPIAVSVVGSYLAGCTLGPSLIVDVAVVMPKKCFLKEDYLNVRYLRKRAIYLGLIANELLSSELIDSSKGIKWETPDGDPLCPRLVMSPSGKLASVTVTLTGLPEENLFKLTRFLPNKSNLRESWMYYGKMKDSSSPTPLYNSSVMRDLVALSNEEFRKNTLESNSNLKDAIALLRVWLRQRKLDTGCGSFSGYIVSMLVCGLVVSRRINNLMSSYQIVRNVWLAISQSDWTKDGFLMCRNKDAGNAPPAEDFHRHFGVVFLDSTGYCNLAARLDPITYFKVRSEAELAVQCLDNPDMNSFHALFMTPMPFLRQFDFFVSITKTRDEIESIIQAECTTEDQTNYFKIENQLFRHNVVNLLSRGLGSRILEIGYKLDPVLEWDVGVEPQHPVPTFLIGFRLNPETAYSVVEKGPPANDPQAAEFRKLWGEQCELRRFRDGSVCEARVWGNSSMPVARRRLVTKCMARALLTERLKITDSVFISHQMEQLVTQKGLTPDGLKYGSGEEVSLAAIQAFDRLAKQLRELPGLPLEVAGVQGVSPVFRGAEVFPPLAQGGSPHAKAGIEGFTCWLLTPNVRCVPNNYISPIQGLITLGITRKWPEDLEAIQRIKAAFYLAIAKAIGGQGNATTQVFPHYLDVFKEGYVFRLSIICPREAVLLKQFSTPDGKLFYRDTPESLELEKFTNHLPKLTAALHGVQQQWPAFSVTCRLAKRWLSTQLIDNSLFPDIVTELLVASLFICPEPFRPLMYPQPMFLRFLNLLAHTNWQLEPIIVNFNSDLKRDDLMEVDTRFHKERETLPPLVIATPYDTNGCVWTREAPILPILVRVTQLSAEALELLEDKVLTCKSRLSPACKVAFRPPMELYDVQIHLKPLLLPWLNQSIDHKQKENFQLKIPKLRRKIPITGFDPAQLYLKELRESYSDFALFFHDTYGGKTIGVLFKPQAFVKQDFKVSHVNCRKVIKEGGKVCLATNFDGIIEDFYTLGSGLVRSIDLNPKYTDGISLQSSTE